MPKYELFHPDHECLGQILIDFENAIGGEQIYPVFQKHGLANIDPEAWYPGQAYMDVLNDLEKNSSVQSTNFVSIGMKQVETAAMPPEFESLPIVEILKMMNDAYRLNNRGTDIGEIRCEVVGERHVKMHIRVPQPDDIWYGICYGYMRRHIQPGMVFTVAYDADVPRREQGGDETIIHISWD